MHLLHRFGAHVVFKTPVNPGASAAQVLVHCCLLKYQHTLVNLLHGFWCIVTC